MTVIRAKGKTMYGEYEIRVTGGKMVESIEGDPAMVDIVRLAVQNSEGKIANGYHPESGTMLQAYAYLTGLFGYNAVEVEGKLDEIPGGEEGVLY